MGFGGLESRLQTLYLLAYDQYLRLHGLEADVVHRSARIAPVKVRGHVTARDRDADQKVAGVLIAYFAFVSDYLDPQGREGSGALARVTLNVVSFVPRGLRRFAEVFGDF